MRTSRIEFVVRCLPPISQNVIGGNIGFFCARAAKLPASRYATDTLDPCDLKKRRPCQDKNLQFNRLAPDRAWPWSCRWNLGSGMKRLSQFHKSECTASE
jgi:hypothetical protein